MADGRDVYFTIRDTEDSAAQLWASDGTAGGTVIVHQEPIDEFVAGGELWGVFGDKLYFLFPDQEHGHEPWVSDGTASGTSLLRDVSGVFGGIRPRQLTPTDDLLYFQGSDNRDTWLWVSDGTAEGTRRVAPELLRRPVLLIPSGNSLFVFASYDSGLWLTDGTEDGTSKLADGTFHFVRETTMLDGVFYFLERDNFPGDVLWRSDGTPAGTFRVVEISGRQGAFSEGLFVVDRKLVFGSPAASGDGVWTSDGTFAGTALIELPFQPRSFVQLGPWVYFESDTALWRTDGTEQGTREVLGYGETLPHTLATAAAAKHLFFVAAQTVDGELTHGIWATDGTLAGTRHVAWLPGRPVSSLGPAGEELVAVGDAVFFAVEDEDSGVELWRADTRDARRVRDICPGPCGSFPQAARAAGAELYFAAFDGSTGLEPWTSDGSAEGTFALDDVAAGPDSSNPEDFVRFAGEVYFQATDAANGSALWAFDDTCRQTPQRVCLADGRFQVSVRWKNQHAGGTEGEGRWLPFSDETTLFYFFSSENVELVLKLLDGRQLNDHFWFFSGGLSDVEYWIDITDRESGDMRTYHNPPGNICGIGDTWAFDGAGLSLLGERPKLAPARQLPPADPATVGMCSADDETLCLYKGRFRVKVRWRNQHGGGAEGTGQAISGTDESGYFWFFSESNMELVVKVLDGRGINGRFWVFFGALSDVEYWITVTDTETGASKTYHNPPGEICGVGDTAAL